MDDDHDALFDENPLSDSGIDVTADDDIAEETIVDQIFDEKLEAELEEGNKIASEPAEAPLPEDEETDSSDSGVNESITSDIDQKDSHNPPRDVQMFTNLGRSKNRRKVIDGRDSPNPPSIAQMITSPGPGRGRFGKKALDENNQELPPPSITSFKQAGYYSEPARIARLPPSYYRNRQDPSVANVRRARFAESPLINFQATFNQILIIVDQDDSKDKSYLHACKCLQEQLPDDIKLNLEKPHYDIWSFGLYIYKIDLEQSLRFDLLKICPQQTDNEEKRPFWFTFKRKPTFQDSIIREKVSKKPDERPGTCVRLSRSIYSDLSYGALTSMNYFYVSDDYIISKKSIWSLLFHEERLEIHTNSFEKLSNDTDPIMKQIKYRISPDIIDRAAIIHLWNDGFSLFLNMKGNVHEFNRERKPKYADDGERTWFKRQGKRDRKIMPSFSTIRLRIQLKNTESIIACLEKDGKIVKDMSDNDKDKILKDTTAELLKQIRETFRNLLDFFYNNRIHVCFGSIKTKNISLQQIETLNNHMFPTFIQSYSWAMLCSIGFRVQVQLYRSQQSINQLHEYSKVVYEDENEQEIDNRFYSLCIYLHRRTSEYFFLDFNIEIQIGINNYKVKYQQYKANNRPVPIFNKSCTSTAYVPSIVLTPTTIKIRPLKLCKLNRVLREKEFGGVLNFALVELRDEAQRLLFPSVFRSLKDQILEYLKDGFDLTSTRKYKYLHHSQSQIKTKQFWFYYHNKEEKRLSHEDAYTWMGNFDKERIVAKHAARIALCFTSTDATIQAETVTYVRDIKDPKGDYTFTDGVGTISRQLRDEIKDFLDPYGNRRSFSVLQIRYGGCKGTLSVDSRLDNQRYQLQIRDSMNKFTTDHDILELCKLSAPRPLFLNRQDIVLLESRDIPHVNFLNLQNEHHFWLVCALLKPENAYKLLQEKLLPVFKLRKIARNINIVEEPFFIKLIITCAFNIIRELLDRTRIYISDEDARNMFGIVDEYDVLENEQIFIQYSPMRQNKLYFSKEEDENDMKPKVITGKVVVTKNPCHHPGDLRVFDAVDHEKLHDLVDVIVFPQKGPRPHPNEISGSDLDGDEYVVIWLKDLIPTTPNVDAYKYDSQEDPPKMDRPITRDDINQIVMEVSEQDCLGSLSNIHLAYADKEEKGIKSKVCTDLAGWISQEVDAAKTGKHPLTEEQIAALRKNFGTEWPDFMKARGKKDYYPSERILGKLYRSARRAANGWVRAISNHGNSRHIQEALALTSDPNKKDRENDETIVKMNIATNYKPILDPYIKHKNYGRYLNDIQHLYRIYQSDLLEIISLYRFHDEVDLLCRCDSMDASASGKKGGIEDSAAIEVKNLTQRTIQAFLAEFKGRDRENNCDNVDTEQNTRRPTKLDCELCNRKITVHCETCNAKKNAVCKNCNKEIQAVCNTWHNKEYVICINCEQKITVVCETCNEKLTVDCETCHEKKPIVMKARKRRIRNHCETCNKILTILCETCDEKIQAKVTAAYIYTYEKSNRLPPKSTQRILSYPWLFSKYLTRVRYFNKPRGLNDQSNNIIGHAFLSYLHEFKPTFKVFVSTNSLNIQLADLHYEEVKEKPASLLLKTKRSDEKICSVPLLRILFIEILNDWFMKQKIFGNECKETDQKPLIPESIWHELIIHFLTGTYQSDVRISSFSKYQNLIMEQYCQIIKNYCQEWSNIESKELYEMFDELHSLTIEHTKRTESTLWSYLDEYIILALQCIGIEKQLTDKWIFLKDSI
ncbi:unnamed protein product [Adineta steineri]|uniref:RDRP core domain-containing protein n=1 Tax=Adineta steineri TaxID=433720 RepID=A0A818YH41_9BILA|nr:unnamed protein product [Adineta steineri]